MSLSGACCEGSCPWPLALDMKSHTSQVDVAACCYMTVSEEGKNEDE